MNQVKLRLLAKKIRKKILHLSFVAKSSHIASSFSIIEILIVLYSFFIKKNKNIFILSKGHACLAYYCVLNHFKFISNKVLNSYGQNKSILMAHASHKVPGVSFSTGSLGHGLPYAVGLALAEKINKSKKNIFVLLSDGELNEGTTWESLMFASKQNLNNLFIIIDYNKIQSFDYSDNVLELEPLKKKFISFNCNVSEVNGHDFKKIYKSLNSRKKNRPNLIIAHTIKGKGVSYMENKIEWHYKTPNKIELLRAFSDLSK